MTRLAASLGIHLLFVIAAVAQPASPAAAPGGGNVAALHLKLLKTIPVGGEGRWDYLLVDPDQRRLYVPRSSHVQVLDVDRGAVLGDVPGTNGVHGVALAREQGLGFASCGRDNAVSVFDLKTLKVVKTVKAGRNPDAILFDPPSGHVMAFNHSGGDVTVIDPAALGKDPASISVGGALEYAVSDGAGHVFVNVEDKDELAEIDTRANRVLAHWSLAPGAGPTGLAIDVEHHRLFAGCGNRKMIVLDAGTGKVLAAVDIGAGVDGVAYDPVLGVTMSANGRDGTLSVVRETSPGTFQTVATPQTLKGARTITTDPKTHRAILPCTVPDANGGQTFGIAVVGAEAAKD
ncbi:MAG TPA: YncE family protein [Tepidisphaeraceae bacterium]|jgi:YVTN family beta-propeller protein